MAATLSHFFDDGNRIRIQTGQSRFVLNCDREVGIERRQIAGRQGNTIDTYFFLPSPMRALVDRDMLIVTDGDMISFNARFSEDEALRLSNCLKEKFEENVRSRGRNLAT